MKKSRLIVILIIPLLIISTIFLIGANDNTVKIEDVDRLNETMEEVSSQFDGFWMEFNPSETSDEEIEELAKTVNPMSDEELYDYVYELAEAHSQMSSTSVA
mgnify:CR=1 FL=1